MDRRENIMFEEQRHSAFPQPDNPNVSLYRYLDFDKFNWMVTHGRLYMPSVVHLGDPIEGTRPNGDLKWWQHEIANAESEEQCHILKHNLELLSRFAIQFRPHYYVSCWHMNESESDQMWNCYTKSPNAVAVQTNYSKLRDLLPFYAEMGMVRYLDYRTNRLPTTNMFEYVTHKMICYNFESEVRVVVLHPPVDAIGHIDFQENYFEDEKKKGFMVFAPLIDVTTLIEHVILHPKATNGFVREIDILCRKKGLVKPVQSDLKGADIGDSG